jgi:YD repeat-containing protein
MEYDGANRMISATDALGNVVEMVYDAGGNVITTTRTEVCTIVPGEGAPEMFVSLVRYDCLNRLIVTATQGAGV